MDINYFNRIDSPEQAYWLGYLWGDSIKKTRILLQNDDSAHFEKFKKAIQAEEGDILPLEDGTYAIRCNLMLADLNYWKSFDRIPNIPKDYVRSFIRGYFDKNGKLYTSSATRKASYGFKVYSRPFVEDLLYELRIIGINTKQKFIQVSGKRRADYIVNYIYKDSTEDSRLTQKYEDYLAFEQWMHPPDAKKKKGKKK
jgi:intein/homing endonuclease